MVQLLGMQEVRKAFSHHGGVREGRREGVSRTGIFHILFALFFLTLTILIFQDLILSTSPHSF